MRLKLTYNLVGSGCSFCYRDNFSGLSNKTVGAAPYIIYPLPTMDKSIYQLISTINTYQRLLQRYAGLIVKNKLVASIITDEVFENYSKQITVIPPAEIKRFLQQYTLLRCHQWISVKNKILILRKPKNPT